MQSIADLTQVRREVVSMWRTRFAGSEHPFPPSLSTQELVFEAGEVAAWLEATGRGNNPDAPLEVLLHSSQFDELLEDLEASSTLLLIHDLVGGPLSALCAEEVLAATAPLDLGALVPPGRLAELLTRSGLVRTLDELAEAAFSGRGLLDRLVSCFSRPHGPWAARRCSWRSCAACWSMRTAVSARTAAAGCCSRQRWPPCSRITPSRASASPRWRRRIRCPWRRCGCSPRTPGRTPWGRRIPAPRTSLCC